ncbi:MAG: TauD/TfdA family dioxygenase [Pseudomonadota bacterium]|nr:TauD/TfdA family dioxygenase [Pseudomonadota bacterium]
MSSQFAEDDACCTVSAIANKLERSMQVAHSVATEAYPFEINRIGDVAGAEIIGLDLSEPIDTATRDAIIRAFLEHHVLVFRNQYLSKDQQAAFSEHFGTLEHHVGRLPNGEPFPIVHTVTNLGPDGKPLGEKMGKGNFHWHTDKSYHEVPSLMTMLHAIQVPLGGGDTQFANTQMGYAALPQETKKRIAEMKAEHSWEASRRNTNSPPATEVQKKERPPVTHPVVRTHPDTKDKLLYIGCHVSHIHDMPRRESNSLLAKLMKHTTHSKFVYSHRWRKGDYVMWDNRCLLHRASPNFDTANEARVLHRTVIVGTVPY